MHTNRLAAVLMAMCFACTASAATATATATATAQNTEQNTAQDINKTSAPTAEARTGVHVYDFSSKLMKDEFKIAVSLPFGYGRKEATYPLILSLDGDVMFGLTREVPRLMSFEGTVPEVIVVSILYGDFRSWIAKRQRDFHSKDGGADIFLKALRDEIIPFVSERYRVNADDKTLYGHSSGGVFALYTAFEDPTLFNRVLASTPSLEEEPAWAESMVKTLADKPYSGPKLIITLGSKETQTKAALAPLLADLGKSEKPVQFRYKEYEGVTHMAVIAGAYADGLRWLFQK